VQGFFPASQRPEDNKIPQKWSLIPRNLIDIGCAPQEVKTPQIGGC